VSKAETGFAEPILASAVEVAEAVGAGALFVYVAAVDNPAALQAAVRPPTRLVLICRDAADRRRAQDVSCEFLNVPPFELTRMGQIKVATLIAFSQQALHAGEAFVFVSGVAGQEIDTLVVMRVGLEYELFQSVGQPKLTEHIRRPVFERVLTLALELAHEGREGKPVGALFVVGDHREVQKYCQEGRINPFRGYPEKERNVLDDTIRDTVKEIAKLDGAFILKGNGVILSGGTTLRPALAGEDVSYTLGARHAAAAAITAGTKSIAVTISESTGTVRVWRRGAMITEIEKAPRAMLDGRPPSTIE